MVKVGKIKRGKYTPNCYPTSGMVPFIIFRVGWNPEQDRFTMAILFVLPNTIGRGPTKKGQKVDTPKNISQKILEKPHAKVHFFEKNPYNRVSPIKFKHRRLSQSINTPGEEESTIPLSAWLGWIFPLGSQGLPRCVGAQVSTQLTGVPGGDCH